jgi:hypothetical protein
VQEEKTSIFYHRKCIKNCYALQFVAMGSNSVLFFPLYQGPVELKKRLEEVRLLESRKSARLMDQDTDFARLADMAGDRKRPSSHSIDVPTVQG